MRKFTMVVTVFALVATLDAQPAEAREKTRAFADGNILHEYCTEESELARTVCTWYIIGVYDAAMSVSVESLVPLICAPKPAQARQIVDVARKFLEDNPDKRHLNASGIVANALKEAFPCN